MVDFEQRCSDRDERFDRWRPEVCALVIFGSAAACWAVIGALLV